MSSFFTDTFNNNHDASKKLLADFFANLKADDSYYSSCSTKDSILLNINKYVLPIGCDKKKAETTHHLVLPTKDPNFSSSLSGTAICKYITINGDSQLEKQIQFDVIEAARRGTPAFLHEHFTQVTRFMLDVDQAQDIENVHEFMEEVQLMMRENVDCDTTCIVLSARNDVETKVFTHARAHQPQLM
jgi:hypothetical protein